MRKTSSVNQIAIFERVIYVLKTIQNTPIATTSELREKALQDLSLRSTQRYLKGLEQAGYVKRVLENGWWRGDARYFLTDKARQLFEVSA